MDFFVPRKLMFKAWNTETRLLIRLDSIPCIRGELQKPHHILLQFTGLKDKQREDLYEMDMVLWRATKYVIQWSTEHSAWVIASLEDAHRAVLVNERAGEVIRICSYFESRKEE